jgi:hypothetical protein
MRSYDSHFRYLSSVEFSTGKEVIMYLTGCPSWGPSRRSSITDGPKYQCTIHLIRGGVLNIPGQQHLILEVLIPSPSTHYVPSPAANVKLEWPCSVNFCCICLFFLLFCYQRASGVHSFTLSQSLLASCVPSCRVHSTILSSHSPQNSNTSRRLTVLYVAIDVLPNPLQPRTWLCFEAVDDGRVPPGWPMKRSRLLIATHILYAEESVWHLPRTDSGRNLRATALRGSNKRLQQF